MKNRTTKRSAYEVGDRVWVAFEEFKRRGVVAAYHEPLPDARHVVVVDDVKFIVPASRLSIDVEATLVDIAEETP